MKLKEIKKHVDDLELTVNTTLTVKAFLLKAMNLIKV